MTRRGRNVLLLAVALLGLGALALWVWEQRGPWETRAIAEPAGGSLASLVEDDPPEPAPPFDPARVDSRPLRSWDGPVEVDASAEVDASVEVNASAAVIELDIPDEARAESAAMRRLFPSFAEAAAALRKEGERLLPSVNFIAAKGKQFDDGLFAALDLWVIEGGPRGEGSLPQLLRALLAALPPFDPSGRARDWLLASLLASGLASDAEGAGATERARGFVAKFDADRLHSTPSGFYTWSPRLERAFRLLRYLQRPFEDEAAPRSIARALASEPALLERYGRLLRLQASVTNPLLDLTPLDLIAPDGTHASLPGVARSEGSVTGVGGAGGARVRLLPQSDSKESVLFARLYPEGLPVEANLMRDLIEAIRSGRLDLAPRAAGGWYEHQAYALETFLLPERGAEHAKLRLTRRYKLRLLEAFRTRLTQVRETHLRQLQSAAGSAAPRLPPCPLRLRCEPSPTYFLRVARAYAFLEEALAEQGIDLGAMHGQKRDGPRAAPLGEELEAMRRLFLGLHLVSCEDIGLAPEPLEGSAGDPTRLREAAAKWLEEWSDDPDLAVDTRVAVPLYVNPPDSVRYWCTIGVRPLRLRAQYVHPPRVREPAAPGKPAGEWLFPGERPRVEAWVLLGEDFLEVERTGPPITREILREACEGEGDGEGEPGAIAGKLAR